MKDDDVAFDDTDVTVGNIRMWMKENVRCDTCKWRREYQQGFVNEPHNVCIVCGNEDSAWYECPCMEDTSCATYWEPKR
jgi:hypothetical protein